MSVHVICFGNYWLGDDGVGIHVYNRLQEIELPAHVRTFDAGILGHGALNCFEDCQKVIVVDAIRLREHVGRVHILGLDDVAEPQEVFCAHALNLNHLFHVLPIIFENRRMPEIQILGVEIERIEKYSEVLTSRVLGSVDVVVDAILRTVHGDCLMR